MWHRDNFTYVTRPLSPVNISYISLFLTDDFCEVLVSSFDIVIYFSHCNNLECT